MRLSRFIVALGAILAFAAPIAAIADTMCCSCTPPNGTAQCLTIDASKVSATGSCNTLPSIVGDAMKGWSCAPDRLSTGACQMQPVGACVADPADAFTAQAGGEIIRPKDSGTTVQDADQAILPKLNVPIPGLTFSPQQGGSNPLLAQYIAAAYRYLISVSAVAATIVFTWGAFMYLLGGAMPSISSGKRIMQDAVIGMLLVLGATLILRTINPNTITFSALNVTAVNPIVYQMANEHVLDPSTTISSTPSGAKTTGVGFLNYTDSDLASARSYPAPDGKDVTFAVPAYLQFSGPWADKAYGPSGISACPGGNDQDLSKAGCCTTYARAGCGATSLAVLLSAAGSSFDPSSVGGYLSRIGSRSCNNGTAFSPQVIKHFNDDVAFNGQKLQSLGSGAQAMQATIETIRGGKPVMFLCGGCAGKRKDGSSKSYNGHYMVLDGVNADGKIFTVHDVGNSNGIVNITQTELLNKAGGFWNITK